MQAMFMKRKRQRQHEFMTERVFLLSEQVARRFLEYLHIMGVLQAVKEVEIDELDELDEPRLSHETSSN